MARLPIRSKIKIEELFKHEPGWYENILYDADFYTLQENIELDKEIKSYLFLIYPVGAKEDKE